MLHHPQEILQKYWGFSTFKGSQKKVIDAVLEGKDVLALLPTGGGKSVCYQIPALSMDGICIVVSPLIALMQNQVDTLQKMNIKAIALTGGIPENELIDLMDNCLYGNYKFLYLSPERLQQELVKEKILRMKVNLVAIDEAHCISQWGNDFRPAYLHCAELREILPEVPMMALTATATAKVAADIVDNLRLQDTLTVKDSFARNNIAFKVLWEEDKRYRLKQLCQQTTKSGIVYVRTRRSAEEMARFLNENGCAATFFHGGIPKGAKDERLQKWLANEIQIMVATNAFGMGIDKPDVRLVVHYQIPDSLENYFQEAGRAGRDGKAAEAILVTNATDETQVRNQFLKILPTIDFLKLTYKKLNNYFQISYGEGNDENYPLSFNTFCEVYQLNPMLTYNSLRILDQNSVIALSESFSRKTTVRFITKKKYFFQYLDHNKRIAPLIQTLLRTYGGVFDYDTKINTLLLSKKANVAEEKILEVLEQLQKDNIITYKAQHNDLEITFLVPREDDKTINVFAKQVKEQQQVKINNVESMLTYIKNDKICRNRQLLGYFGEKNKEECGKCDVCERNQKVVEDVQKVIAQDLLKLLEESPKTSRLLIELLPYKEAVILEILKQLLEDEKLYVNEKNEYEPIR
ncbi:ATP-dependent DNA helicase RecQ [Spongiimicrobium sp. 3-5]|uniref:RecQ family ATP-dependent DNA helicase n=1 Tax=Spongiimicrobium sp. 3-5 TaxID=3332596 RepID=UPI00398154E9